MKCGSVTKTSEPPSLETWHLRTKPIYIHSTVVEIRNKKIGDTYEKCEGIRCIISALLFGFLKFKDSIIRSYFNRSVLCVINVGSKVFSLERFDEVLPFNCFRCKTNEIRSNIKSSRTVKYLACR